MREHLHPHTDDSLMPFGEHRGVRLGDVPAKYLAWLKRQPWIASWKGLHEYLQSCPRTRQAAKEEETPEEETPMGYNSYEDFMSDS